MSVWGDNVTQSFNALRPHDVLEAIELLGLRTNGQVFQLNSMENRVFDVGLELNSTPKNPSEASCIIKFYRPGRWSKDQIQDEHTFLGDLIQHDIKAIAPLKFDEKSIFEYAGLYYCLFPKRAGRSVDEWNNDLIEIMGRTLARLHNVGESAQASYRLKLDVKNFGEHNLEFLNQSPYLTQSTLFKDYTNTARDVLSECRDVFQLVAPKFLRIHGDCHHGNVLQHDGVPFLIDFDDMTFGPAVQDIWMITPGIDPESIALRDKLIDSYTEMREFNHRELYLIHALRSLRIIHFSSWIAHRYEDQSFKRIYPDFGTTQYWEKEIFELKNLLSLIKNDHNKLRRFM